MMQTGLNEKWIKSNLKGTTEKWTNSKIDLIYQSLFTDRNTAETTDRMTDIYNRKKKMKNI